MGVGSRVLRGSAVLVSFAGLAIVHTYPLIRTLGTHVPGRDLGDNASFLWNFWWMREAIASERFSFFWSPYILWPVGGSLVLHTHTAFPAFVGATLLSALDVVTAQNVLLIATVALNGWCAYLLCFQVCGNRTSAIAGGALFLLSPVILQRLMGHFNLVAAWPMCLAAWALLRVMAGGATRDAVALGVSAGMLPYFDYYYTIYFGLFGLVYVLASSTTLRLRVLTRVPSRLSRGLGLLTVLAAVIAVAVLSWPQTEVVMGSIKISLRTATNALTAVWLCLGWWWLSRHRIHASYAWTSTLSWRPYAVAAVMAIVVCAPVLMAMVSLAVAGDYVAPQSALRSGPQGVDVATLFLGPPFGPLVGSSVRGAYARFSLDPMESSAWLGIALPVLTLLACRHSLTDHRFRRWALVAAFFAVWSLGPYLMIFGHNTGLILPQASAHFVPILNNARMPGRALAPMAMALSVMVALWISRGTPDARIKMARLGLMALGVVEGVGAPLPAVPIPDPAIYQELKNETGESAVLPLPFGMGDGFEPLGALDHEALTAQMFHHHPLVGGFLARIPKRTFDWYQATEPYQTLLLLSSGSPVAVPGCESVVPALSAHGVGYVVWYRSHSTPAIDEFVARLPLTPIGGDATRRVFRLGTSCR